MRAKSEPKLPHERDESANATGAEPSDKVEQASFLSESLFCKPIVEFIGVLLLVAEDVLEKAPSG